MIYIRINKKWYSTAFSTIDAMPDSLFKQINVTIDTGKERWAAPIVCETLMDVSYHSLRFDLWFNEKDVRAFSAAFKVAI
jgi:hypothetical protein